ncbi:TetR family transcriptional regulator [Curtobacterium sp. MCJR17_055]|uniref:TetR/AcrR family transcriptional regulator n=1 Tax=unclassified Curtobacterium TaxID=257496 RepID=UPI000D959908|nr:MULTISPECIES: TetR/AcrR family transcriptional regulator [unclassified Curtobacterium]PYY33358.1 TetR family transcriptional regulator [Curtobacterium sp. MCBD17_029]PYY53302.1 TetR family transcriptional regulator [Curtobacterium sp. MCJR17_055]PYY56456.1 TetR family transcriptional regulator [Curtobacterium sp. MCPF17_015]
MPDAPVPRADVRDRIVTAAAELLRRDGAAGVTTRAVSDRAHVQPPTIYRLFGDKDGLLDAVAEHAMTEFGRTKADAVHAAAEHEVDPVADLRTGWDLTIGFGLDNPDLFVIMSDPRRGNGSPAVAAGLRLLEDRLRRVAAAGRLAVRERDAVRLLHAAGTGAVLTLLEEPEGERDPALADAAFAAVMTQICTPDPSGAAPDGPSATRTAALTLRSVAPDLTALSPAERSVLAEWLDRVVDHEGEPGHRGRRGEQGGSGHDED